MHVVVFSEIFIRIVVRTTSVSRNKLKSYLIRIMFVTPLKMEFDVSVPHFCDLWERVIKEHETPSEEVNGYTNLYNRGVDDFGGKN